MDKATAVDTLNAILKAAAQGGASDVHIKENAPVIVRISRKLISMECPVPTREWFEGVLDHMVPIHLKGPLDQDRESDFSYFSPDCGRFRTNVYQQSGKWAMALRYVKSNAPDIEQLGLSPMCKTLAES